MIYGKDILPGLSTTKIILNKSKPTEIEVKYCLNIISKNKREAVNKYIQTKNKNNEIKIVLILLSSQDEDLIPKLKNPSFRPSALEEVEKRKTILKKEIDMISVLSAAHSNSMSLSTNKQLRAHKFHNSQTFFLKEEIDFSSINKLCLLSFVQVSGKDKFLNPYKTNLQPIGGTCTYDLLLHRGENQELFPPTSRNVFYIKSEQDPKRMVPYQGPYHKMPGHNKYMTGASHLATSKELQIKKISNYKITIKDQLKIGEEQNTAARIVSTFPVFGTGESIEKHAKLSVGFDRALENKQNEEMFHFAMSSEKKKLSSFLDIDPSETVHISASERSHSKDSANIANNYYAFLASIDFLDILKYKTRLGPVLDHHQRNKNYDLILQILSGCKILEFKVIRRRLEDRANQVNSLGTKKYGLSRSKNSEINIVMTKDSTQPNSSSRSFKDKLNSKSNLLGSIEEIDVYQVASDRASSFVKPEANSFSRQFLIKDFDLIHNVESGKYTYSIELVITDGFSSLLEKMSESLEKTINIFSRLLEKSSLRTTHKTGKYKQLNIEKKDLKRFKKITNLMISLYKESFLILSGKPIDQNKNRLLSSMLEPALAERGDMLNALQMFRQTSILIKNLLGKSKNMFFSNSSVSSKSSEPKDQIKVSIDTNIAAHAIKSSNLLADFSLKDKNMSQLLPGPVFLENISLSGRLSSNSFVSPRRFLYMEPLRYDRKTAFEYQSRGTEKIEKIAEQKTHIISDFESHSQMSNVEKDNLFLKLSVLDSSESTEGNYFDKGESFFPSALQILNGVEIRTTSEELQSTSQEEDSFHVLPDASTDLKESMYQSAIQELDENTALGIIEENFKNLSFSRSELGTAYRELYMKIQIGSLVRSYASKDSRYEKRFSLSSQGASQIGSSDFYEKYTSHIECVGFNGKSMKIDLSNLKFTNKL